MLAYRTLIYACLFGETSRRTIGLSSVAIAALRAHQARQAEERRVASDRADNVLVCATHFGTPLIRRNITRDFKARSGVLDCLQASASTTWATLTQL